MPHKTLLPSRLIGVSTFIFLLAIACLNFTSTSYAVLAKLDELDKRVQEVVDYAKSLGDEGFEATGQEMSITLEDAIFFTLRDNEDVENNYLTREGDILSLESVKNGFRIQGTFSVDSAISRSYTETGAYSETVTLPSPTVSLSKQLLSGGSLSFSWSGGYNVSRKSNTVFDASADRAVSLTYNQPLLKGAGFEIGSLPLTRAYINEEESLLTLRSSIISKVVEVITAYRNYVKAIEDYKIQENSIERLRAQLDHAKARIEAGLAAPLSLVERRQTLARNELSYQASLNNREQQRLNLLRLMNMDPDINLIPIEEQITDLDYIPTVEECLEIAFVRNTSYAGALLSLRSSELSYLQAKNDQLWDLGLTAQISNSAPGGISSIGEANYQAWQFKDRTATVGLTLSFPVNRFSLRKGLIDSRLSLRSSTLSLRKNEEDLRKTIKDQLRDIKSKLISLKLSQVSLELAKRKFQGKKVQYESGRLSDFEFDDAESDLIQAETDELSARIELLNSLTSLNQTLGVTLDVWSVNLKDRQRNKPKLEDTLFRRTDKDEEGKENDETEPQEVAYYDPR